MTVPSVDRMFGFFSDNERYVQFVATAAMLLGGPDQLVETGALHAHNPHVIELDGQRIRGAAPSLRTVEHLQPYIRGRDMQPHVQPVLDPRLHLYLVTEMYPNARPIGKPRLLLQLPGYTPDKDAADIWWPSSVLRVSVPWQLVDFLSDLKEQLVASLYLRRAAATPGQFLVPTGT